MHPRTARSGTSRVAAVSDLSGNSDEQDRAVNRVQQCSRPLPSPSLLVLDGPWCLYSGSHCASTHSRLLPCLHTPSIRRRPQSRVHAPPSPRISPEARAPRRLRWSEIRRDGISRNRFQYDDSSARSTQAFPNGWSQSLCRMYVNAPLAGAISRDVLGWGTYHARAAPTI